MFFSIDPSEDGFYYGILRLDDKRLYVETDEDPNAPLPPIFTDPNYQFQAIVTDYIKSCLSIAEMVEKYPQHHYAMTFFEGNGFAYMED